MGFFNFNNVHCIAKDQNTPTQGKYAGRTFRKLQFSNGKNMYEMSVNENDAAAVADFEKVEPFKIYSGSCDYSNGFFQMTSCSEVKK